MIDVTACNVKSPAFMANSAWLPRLATTVPLCTHVLCLAHPVQSVGRSHEHPLKGCIALKLPCPAAWTHPAPQQAAHQHITHAQAMHVPSTPRQLAAAQLPLHTTGNLVYHAKVSLPLHPHDPSILHADGPGLLVSYRALSSQTVHDSGVARPNIDDS